MKHITFQGYIAIMTVLVLLAFSLTLLLSVPYLSIDGARQAIALAQGETVLAGVMGCAEDALLLSTRDENYTGGSYEYLGITCEVNIEKNDQRWTLSIIGGTHDTTRALEIAVDRTTGTPGTLTLVHWLEK